MHAPMRLWVGRTGRELASITGLFLHRSADARFRALRFAPPAPGALVFSQAPSIVSAHDDPAGWMQDVDPIIVLLDGRLDHRQRLAGELGLNGADKTDVDLIRAAYRRWDAGWIERTHGSLAVVIIDTIRDRLLACRDELGRAPLYYHLSPAWLLLSSSPADLLRHPEVGGTRDPGWLAWYFGAFQTEVGDRSPFIAIRHLLPNQTLIWDARKDAIEFRLASHRLGRQRIFFRQERDYAEGFRERLSASIQDRTRGIEKMGILLSGGMDSCPLGCLAAEQFRLSGQQLTAYSWTLRHFPQADETRELGDCAAFAGIPTVLVPGDDLLPFTNPLDDPVDPNSPISNAFWRLFDAIYRKAAADGCRVVLQGTFGDRLYPHGWEVADALSDGEWAIAAAELHRLRQRLGWRGTLKTAAVRKTAKRLLPIQRFLRRRAPVWLTQEAADLLNARHWSADGYRHRRPEHYQSLLGPRLFETSVGHQRDPISHGIHRLDPFHDWDLIDYMLAIPAYQSYRLGQTKYLARNAMMGRMPEALRTRPRGSLMSSFFDAGLFRASDDISAFLSEPDCTWPQYLMKDQILMNLRDPDASGLQKVLVQMALSYELWNRTLSEMGFP